MLATLAPEGKRETDQHNHREKYSEALGVGITIQQSTFIEHLLSATVVYYLI